MSIAALSLTLVEFLCTVDQKLLIQRVLSTKREISDSNLMSAFSLPRLGLLGTGLCLGGASEC